MASDDVRRHPPDNHPRVQLQRPSQHAHDSRQSMNEGWAVDDLFGQCQETPNRLPPSSNATPLPITNDVPPPQSQHPPRQYHYSHQPSPQQYYQQRPSDHQQYYQPRPQRIHQAPRPPTQTPAQHYDPRAQRPQPVPSLESRPYVYSRGQEVDFHYDSQSWHDSETSTQTSSPVYSYEESDEERGRPAGMAAQPPQQWHQEKRAHADFEQAFPQPRYDHAQAYSQHAQAYVYQQQYRGTGQQAPLIDHVTNDWRREDGGSYYAGQYAAGRYHSANDPRRRTHQRKASEWSDDDTTGCCNGECDELIRSKACRRWFIMFSVIVISMVWFLIWIVTPENSDRARMQDSIKWRMNSGSNFFGTNMHVAMSGTTQVVQLERWKVPMSGEEREGAAKSSERRLIIVGDIHGCAKELTQLLETVSFNPSKDHVVTTGDMISKGPSSLEVLHILMMHNASCVRGNHEDRILLAHRDYHAPSHSKSEAGADGDSDTASPSTTKTKIKHGAVSDLELASDLSDAQIAYLEACPVVLELGALPGMGSVTVAHAGLVPMVNHSMQDPLSVLNMRSIDLRTHYPSRSGPPDDMASKWNPKDKSRDRFGRTWLVAWPRLWDVWQSFRNLADREHVVYGHDSDAGLVLGKYTWGLDASCVKGGQLAALVISPGAKEVARDVVKVQCADYLPDEAVGPELGAN